MQKCQSTFCILLLSFLPQSVHHPLPQFLLANPCTSFAAQTANQWPAPFPIFPLPISSPIFPLPHPLFLQMIPLVFSGRLHLFLLHYPPNHWSPSPTSRRRRKRKRKHTSVCLLPATISRPPGQQWWRWLIPRSAVAVFLHCFFFRVLATFLVPANMKMSFLLYVESGNAWESEVKTLMEEKSGGPE
jgi:hypothetical protein